MVVFGVVVSVVFVVVPSTLAPAGVVVSTPVAPEVPL
jgi:hypothetical protein